MKAIYFSRFGPPKNLQIKEIPKPVPKANEVLVEVKAVAVNDFDWSLVRGKPFLYRLMFGFRKPTINIPGMEVSGVVTHVGSKVSNLNVGDRVFGDTSDYGFGGMASFVALHENALLKMPESMSYEEAASMPHAALLAYQGLHWVAQLKEGQSVLINGAGGGVGHFALQLAKLKKCEVTGVDSGAKLEHMKQLGYDHVIDYQTHDFTRSTLTYNVVLDCKTNRPARAYLRSLASNGIYVTVGGKVGRLAQIYLFGRWISIGSTKRLKVLGLKPNKDLDKMVKLYQEGNIHCAIDGPYPLVQAGEQLQRFGDGKHLGKIILRV